MHQEDTIWTERLRKGDMQAFEVLFRSYYEKLCLFANRLTDDLHVAEEIVADTYAFIWEKRETLLISYSFRAYIYRAVQNRCLNHLKHRNVVREYVDYVLQAHLHTHDYQDLVREEELEREVAEAIESLPDKCREIFKLSRYQHLRYSEIARKLGLSPKTVERQMSIALEKLRRHLKHLLAPA